MKTRDSGCTGVFSSTSLVLLLLLLGGCAQTVWVKSGATSAKSEAAMEQCLSDAYLQALGPVGSYSWQRCRGAVLYNMLRSGLQRSLRHVAWAIHGPMNISYDANARTRSQIYRQCMQAAGWSEQSRSALAAAPLVPEDDWTRGFDIGERDGANAQCATPPAGIADGRGWTLGCRSGQQAR